MFAQLLVFIMNPTNNNPDYCDEKKFSEQPICYITALELCTKYVFAIVEKLSEENLGELPTHCLPQKSAQCNE